MTLWNLILDLLEHEKDYLFTKNYSRSWKNLEIQKESKYLCDLCNSADHKILPCWGTAIPFRENTVIRKLVASSFTRYLNEVHFTPYGGEKAFNFEISFFWKLPLATYLAILALLGTSFFPLQEHMLWVD